MNIYLVRFRNNQFKLKWSEYYADNSVLDLAKRLTELDRDTGNEITTIKFISDVNGKDLEPEYEQTFTDLMRVE